MANLAARVAARACARLAGTATLVFGIAPGIASAASMCAGTHAVSTSGPMTYTATVVTDVSLAGHMHRSAELTFTFHGDMSNVYTFVLKDSYGGTGGGSCIDQGKAFASIATSDGTISTEVLPGQLLVAFDTYNGGIGFSSYLGPNGFEPAYPLAYTEGTVEDFTFDLVTPISMSGRAWSCIGYPIAPYAGGNGYCTDPETYPIKTAAGPLIVYMPYQRTNPDGTIWGDYSGSMNRGVFSIFAGTVGH